MDPSVEAPRTAGCSYGGKQGPSAPRDALEVNDCRRCRTLSSLLLRVRVSERDGLAGSSRSCHAAQRHRLTDSCQYWGLTVDRRATNTSMDQESKTGSAAVHCAIGLIGRQQSLRLPQPPPNCPKTAPKLPQYSPNCLGGCIAAASRRAAMPPVEKNIQRLFLLHMLSPPRLSLQFPCPPRVHVHVHVHLHLHTLHDARSSFIVISCHGLRL